MAVVCGSTKKKREAVALGFLLISLTLSLSYKINCSIFCTDSSFSFSILTR